VQLSASQEGPNSMKLVNNASVQMMIKYKTLHVKFRVLIFGNDGP
jgi:hypothetical protein